MIIPAVSYGLSESSHYAVYRDVEGEEKLAIFDVSLFELLVFDLSSHKLENKIKFPDDGPNHIGPYNGFMSFFVDADGVLNIWNNVTSIIYKLSWEGDVVDKTVLDVGLGDEFGVRPYMDYHRRPVFADGTIFLFNMMSDPKSNDFTKMPMSTVFNHSQFGKMFAKKVGFYLPEEYNRGLMGYAQFKYVPSAIYLEEEQEFLVSFPLSGKVHRFDLDGELISDFEMRSSFFKAPEPLRSIDFRAKMFTQEVVVPDSEEIDMYDLTSSDYNYLMKEVKSGLFIRVANVRPEVEAYKNGDTTPDFSLLFFNNEYEKLGEVFLDGNMHNLFMSFSTDKGFYVMNYEETYNRDGEIFFDVFDIKEID